MSLYASCPCGIPEGSPEPHVRTDCPLYDSTMMPPTASHDAARERFSLDERDDDMLIAERHWQWGWRCIARRPKLLSNDEWRPEAERIVNALVASAKADAMLAALPTTDGAEVREACAKVAESEPGVPPPPRSGGSFAASRADQCKLVAAAIRALPLPIATPPTTDASERMQEAWAKASKFLRHDGLCAVIGGYGYCSCGLDETKARNDVSRTSTK